jgi:hypothetical protein
MLHNILSPNEIAEILNDPIVKTNKDKLSIATKVDFSIQVSEIIKTKLETIFNLNLSQNTTIPMRWIKGDTPPHTDKAEEQFTNTYLMYLTDSVGELFIDGQSYEIKAGDAHIFNEGVEHYTINTGSSERLLIGPMNEMGVRVGAPVYIIYFSSESNASTETDGVYGTSYTVETVNDVSSWIIYSNVYGTDPTPNGGPYSAGTTLVETGVYYVYPYVAPPPPPPSPSIYSMRSLFTDNARVYYKPNSLYISSGGVTNSRHKKRRV